MYSFIRLALNYRNQWLKVKKDEERRSKMIEDGFIQRGFSGNRLKWDKEWKRRKKKYKICSI